MDDLRIQILTELELDKNSLVNLQKDANKLGINLKLSLDEKDLTTKINKAVKDANKSIKIDVITDETKLKNSVGGYIKTIEQAKEEARKLISLQKEFEGFQIGKTSTTAIYDKAGKETDDKRIALELYNKVTQQAIQLSFLYESSTGKVIQTGQKEIENVKQLIGLKEKLEQQEQKLIATQASRLSKIGTDIEKLNSSYGFGSKKQIIDYDKLSMVNKSLEETNSQRQKLLNINLENQIIPQSELDKLNVLIERYKIIIKQQQDLQYSANKLASSTFNDSQNKELSKFDFNVAKFKSQKLITKEDVLEVNNLKKAIQNATDTTSLKRATDAFDVFINKAKQAQQEIKVFTTVQLKEQGRLYVTDRSKGDIVQRAGNAIKAQMADVEKVEISAKESFVGAKKYVESFTATVTKANGEIQKIPFELAKIGKSLSFVETGETARKFNGSVLTEAQKEIQNLQREVSKLTQKNGLNKDIQNLEQNLRSFSDKNKFSASLKEQLNIIVELRTKLKEITSDKAYFNKEDIFDVTKIGDPVKLKELINLMAKITDEQSKFDVVFNNANKTTIQDTRYIKASNELKELIVTMESYKRSNSKIQTNSGIASDLDSIIEQARNLNESANSGDYNGLYSELNKIRNEFGKVKTEASAENLTGQTFLGRLIEQAQKLGIYLSGAAIVMGSWRQIKQMIGDVVELDSVVTDLQIATGYTREETKKLLSTYSELGKVLGATTIDVGKSADGWLRQGYSVAETNKLIKDSLMLSKLGQMESTDATKALTSSQKGYKMSVEETTSIVDKLTAVDMEAAVSAGYVATAMSETATSARLAGVDINRLVGYITTVGEVTQDGAESLGTFYKSLFARMGNIKDGNLYDPVNQEELNNVERTLNGLDIKLRTSGGEFRNFGDVLDEVAGRWNTYSSVQQRALAVAFSGVHHQEKFLVLMDNYKTAMNYAEIATNSAGNALDKYENSYLKSVAAAQERFNAQFEQLSSTLINSDLIKGTFDAGTGVLGFLSKVINVLDDIPTLTTVAITALSAITNKGWLIESDKIRPLQSDGDVERVKHKDGVFNKRLYSKCLKWCA